MDLPTPPQLPEHVHIRAVVSAADVAVGDARRRAPRGAFAAPEIVDQASLVLVRRGVFRRRTSAGEFTLDPTLAYFARGGELQQFAHPCAGGDATTLIQVWEKLAAALAPARWRALSGLARRREAAVRRARAVLRGSAAGPAW